MLIERLDDARSRLLNLDLSTDQHDALYTLLQDAASGLREAQHAAEGAEGDAAVLRDALRSYVRDSEPFMKVRQVFESNDAGAQLLAELRRLREVEARLRVAGSTLIDAWAEVEDPTPLEVGLSALAIALGETSTESPSTTTTPEDAARQAQRARDMADRWSALITKETDDQ